MQKNVHKFYDEFGYFIAIICVGYKEVERVGMYKLLGVIISDDLKWNAPLFRLVSSARYVFLVSNSSICVLREKYDA